MKVKDLIQKLQELDGELPVCVADWQEQYATESEYYAELISVGGGQYKDANHQTVTGQHVTIGE